MVRAREPRPGRDRAPRARASRREPRARPRPWERARALRRLLEGGRRGLSRQITRVGKLNRMREGRRDRRRGNTHRGGRGGSAGGCGEGSAAAAGVSEGADSMVRPICALNTGPGARQNAKIVRGPERAFGAPRANLHSQAVRFRSRARRRRSARVRLRVSFRSIDRLELVPGLLLVARLRRR